MQTHQYQNEYLNTFATKRPRNPTTTNRYILANPNYVNNECSASMCVTHTIHTHIPVFGTSNRKYLTLKLRLQLADTNFTNFMNFFLENFALIKKFEGCRKISFRIVFGFELYFMLRPIIRSLILKGFGIKTVVK